MEGYYNNFDKISKQRKIFYEKSRDKNLLQEKNNRIIQISDSVISYVELENRLKAMEEKLKISQ